MKVLRYKLILSVLLPFILISAATARQNIDTDKLDQFFTQLADNNRFMGSVAVMLGDNVVFNEACGKISGDGIPATSRTVYRIGSITKSYTATMVLQLLEQGELSLDTTLDTYSPDMPNAGQITIEHLLRHQSGLVNFTNLPDYMEYFTGDRSREQMLDRFQSAGTSFAPGESTEYSNTGYVLLGYIIEEETGQSYADALQNMITDPLGLISTYFATGINPEENEANSFVFQQDEWQPASRTNMQIPHGA